MLEPVFQSRNESSGTRDDIGPVISGNLSNPFPGLRPFDIDECHLFFGRESHADEILLKLSQHKFVTVLGYSGSGKSSLMYCGVIPTLYGGFMTESGPDWTVITTRPGNAPIENLAASIVRATQDIDENSSHFQLQQKIIESVLRSSPDGIYNALKSKKRIKQNFLILTDQFEEIFRLRKEKPTYETNEETSQYVNLILNAKKNPEANIYVAVTMRSDFIGDCSVFGGLNDEINVSNYLVPRMNPGQRRIAIEGPVSVGGGRISRRLLKRLQEEVGDNQDQLPILQHAMMRTWDYWMDNRDENEPLDLRHYNAVGKISGALSQHADEIYEELTSKQKQIAEFLFKSLTQKGQDNQGLRRPARLGDVAQLAGVSADEVIDVVEIFRRPGRSFLMPSHGVALDQDSNIEISHESLMRIWVRLKNWVDEEYESAQMYMRLSEAAEMYQVGRTGLWRPPDLQLALNWQKKQRPNRLWAQRYNEAFERAITFLDTSRITWEAEQKNQEMRQKRLLRRTRLAAIALGAAFIIAIAFFIFGAIQQNRAVQQAQLANDRLIEVEREKANVETQKVIADSARDFAIRQSELAEERALEIEKANSQLQKAFNDLQTALSNEKVALTLAEQEKDNAIAQTNEAQKQRVKADSALVLAKKEYDRAQDYIYQIIAQSMATKAPTVDDVNIASVLAFQAYQFNDMYGGRDFDPYIYNGLHAARVKMEGQTYNTISAHKSAVSSVAFPNSSDIFYSTGSDGSVVKNTFSTKESQVLSTSRYRNKIVEVSPDANYLVSGGDSTFINIFDISGEPKKKDTYTIHNSYINDVAFLPDNTHIFTSSGDKTIKKVNIQNGNTEIFHTSVNEYKVLEVSKDGSILAAAGLKGVVTLFNLATGQETTLNTGRKDPVYSIAISPDATMLAFGDESGHSELWNIPESKKLRDLGLHKARVSDVEFSDNGLLLATSSWDKTVNIWVLEELSDLPITLTDNDAWVMDVDFSPESDYLLAACEDGEIRFWTTKASDLAEGMCNEIERNLTIEEWENYVSNDENIPYKNTCLDKIMDQ